MQHRTLNHLIFTTAFLVCAVASTNAQSVQVPLETTTGWGVVRPPDGFKGLRIQGRSAAPPLVLARLFGDFAAHPAMFPRVVEDVDILSCDERTLRARYRTKFDPKPGKKTEVESLSRVTVTVTPGRIEFIWGSNELTSSFVNAVWGRMLFVTQPGATGPETLVDYVSAVRPKNSAKGVLVETQKSVLANDARYVIDRLLALAAGGSTTEPAIVSATSNLFNCQ